MTLNLSLPPHLESFIHRTVDEGRYQSADEVVRMALRLLEECERNRAARLDALRREVQIGLESGPSEPLTDEFWQSLRDQLRRREHSGNHG